MSVAPFPVELGGDGGQRLLKAAIFFVGVSALAEGMGALVYRKPVVATFVAVLTVSACAESGVV
jgi:hypothetical protein